MEHPPKEKNVEYILVAEFDIDKGSTITFQYPEPPGEDAQLLAELMLPDGVHKREDDWTVFFLRRPPYHEHKRKSMILPSSPSTPLSPSQTQNNRNSFGEDKPDGSPIASPIPEDEERPFLYCLNLVNNRKDTTVRRGAVVKAIAVCTRHQYIQVFKPIIILALHEFYTSPGEEVLVELYKSLNEMDVSSMPHYTDHQKQIIRTSNDRTKQEFITNVSFYKINMKLKIPTTLFPDEVGDIAVITLIKKFGTQFMTIYNALLCQKRILFLGFDCSAGEVCHYTLAACSMVCPPLKGIIKRAFPYTNLTYLDFLSVPGYVAGVTNPMFEQHTEWWDVLCNINTGKILVNQQWQPQVEKMAQIDQEWTNQVIASVNSHYGEDSIRSLLQNFTQHILYMAFDEEEFPDVEAGQVELEKYRYRIDTWRRTLTGKIYAVDREERSEIPIQDPLVGRFIRRLKIRKKIAVNEMLQMFKVFLENTVTNEQILEFLSWFPESTGGLSPIAFCLFHSSEDVRKDAARLFKRLDSFKTGTGFIHGLNDFILLQYNRTLKLLND